MKLRPLLAFVFFIVPLRLSAVTPAREEILAATLQPYTGPSERGVDTSTLTGKVMCGYQGWFACEGDGGEIGNQHWTKKHGPLAPGNAKIDLWPDVSELGPDERFSTGFQLADGKPAEVFSSFKQATVLRHFRWMREYGIDGAFVQRFIASLRDANSLRMNNTVLAHCREGANRNGRAYAVMYDLSGLGAGRIREVMERLAGAADADAHWRRSGVSAASRKAARGGVGRRVQR